MKATIITIGDEILIGQIVDTNSVSIAKHLNAAGIVVHEKVSIGDDSTQIVRSVERALGDSNVVVITGGLGPTKDDITKKTLAGMFGCELVPDQRVADHVKRMLEGRGIEFNELNRGQAMVPACCTVLFNAHGTAPGMWFERNGKVVVSLPGVPYEMEHLMQDEVMPRLKARFALRQIVHRTLITSGLAESLLAERLERQGIGYLIQEVAGSKVNLYFGKRACLDAVRMFIDKPLNRLTPEEDFMLGTMLGYDIAGQCERYCKRLREQA